MTAGRKEKQTGYSVLSLARRLIFMRAEVGRMGKDGRVKSEEDSLLIAESLDEAIEMIFQTYLEVLSEKRNYPYLRENWDRVKWEKKLVCGMNKEPYRTRYLERAGLA